MLKICHFQGMHGIKEILGIGTTSSLFKYKQLVMNIGRCKRQLDLETNSVTLRITEEADVHGFGILIFAKQLVEHIFTLKDVFFEGRVTFDSSVKDSFMVHFDGKIKEFVRDN